MLESSRSGLCSSAGAGCPQPHAASRAGREAPLSEGAGRQANPSAAAPPCRPRAAWTGTWRGRPSRGWRQTAPSGPPTWCARSGARARRPPPPCSPARRPTRPRRPPSCQSRGQTAWPAPPATCVRSATARRRSSRPPPSRRTRCAGQRGPPPRAPRPGRRPAAGWRRRGRRRLRLLPPPRVLLLARRPPRGWSRGSARQLPPRRCRRRCACAPASAAAAAPAPPPRAGPCPRRRAAAPPRCPGRHCSVPAVRPAPGLLRPARQLRRALPFCPAPARARCWAGCRALGGSGWERGYGAHGRGLCWAPHLRWCLPACGSLPGCPAGQRRLGGRRRRCSAAPGSRHCWDRPRWSCRGCRCWWAATRGPWLWHVLVHVAAAASRGPSRCRCLWRGCCSSRTCSPHPPTSDTVGGDVLALKAGPASTPQEAHHFSSISLVSAAASTARAASSPDGASSSTTVLRVPA